MAFNKKTHLLGENAQINLVEPIRSKEDLKRICQFFDEKGWHKYTVIFQLGINSGLRISDILVLKVKDVRNADKIIIREIKTGKTKEFPIRDEIKPLLNDWAGDLPDEAWLFEGRKGRHLDRSQVYRRINEAIDALHIDANVGTHTLRKTFGYHHYKQFHDVAMLQVIFNHTSPDVTLRYIGINQEEINKSYEAFNLNNDPEDLDALKKQIRDQNNRKRIERTLNFCKTYIKSTRGKGIHVDFARIIVEIIKYTQEYTEDYTPKMEADLFGYSPKMETLKEHKKQTIKTAQQIIDNYYNKIENDLFFDKTPEEIEIDLLLDQIDKLKSNFTEEQKQRIRF